MNKLFTILDKFKDRKVLVIGDVMLDKYIWGDVSRISPEAPVQVVNVEKEDNVPGGAANAASNVSALGGTVFIVGTVGDDGAKVTLRAELEKRGIITDCLVTDRRRPTIQKTRVVARSQQLLRVDYELTDGVGELVFEKIFDTIKRTINDVDIVIVSDYEKGVITKKLMESLVKLCKEKKKLLIVDPKLKNMEIYKGCDLLTPNHLEASLMTGIEEKTEDDLKNMGEALMAKLDCEVLITRGEKGISLFKRDGKVKHISTKAKEVYDVTGAGDTVVATLALALSSGATLEEAAFIANHAAGIVVGKVGTSTATVKELKEDIKESTEE